MIVQVLLDSGNKLAHIPKTSPANALVGEFAEPPFHQIQPRTRRWGKVERAPWMPTEPGFYPGMLVGSIVVNDEMQVDLRRGLGVDRFEETDEFLMPMSRHAIADHLAIEHAEGRKQRGRAVAFVVVRHRPAAPFLQRQTRLGAIEGLDLTFLVHAQHEGFVRGIEIQSHDIVELLDKVCVAAEFEGLDEVRRKLVVLPDTADGSLAEPLGLGHAARAPMGRVRWCHMQGGFDDGADFLLRNARDTPRTWGVLLQSCHPQRQETFPPELHSRSGDSQVPCDVLIAHAVGRPLDNFGSLHQPPGNTSPMRPRGQDRALLSRQVERGSGSHTT